MAEAATYDPGVESLQGSADWLQRIAPQSWAHGDITGEPREWTPRMPVRSVTTSSNVDALDGLIRADATGGSITLTLETAIGCDGRIHHIKKTDASANTVMIDGNGSETINGVSRIILTYQNQLRTIVSNGTGWDILCAY